MREKSGDGFTLLELAVAIGLTSMIILVAASQIDILQRTTHRSQLRDSIADRREQLRAFLTSDTAWGEIIKANPGMSCLTGGNPCALGVSKAFRLIENSGKTLRVLADAQNPNLGFTIDGQVCSKFSDPKDRTCIFRVEKMTWTAECENDQVCLDPQVLIRGHFKVKNSTISAAAPPGQSNAAGTNAATTNGAGANAVGNAPVADQSFFFYRAKDALRLSMALKGDLLPSIGKCPAGQFVAGFDDKGGMICID